MRLAFLAFFCSCSLALAGEYSTELNSILLLLDNIQDDVNDMRTDYAQDYPELLLEIESIDEYARRISTLLTSNTDSQSYAFNVLIAQSQLSALTSRIDSLDSHLRALGVGTVTNWLGQTDFDEWCETLSGYVWDAFDERYTDGDGGIYVIPYSDNYMYDMGSLFVSSGRYNDWYAYSTVADILQGSTRAIYRALTNLTFTISTNNISIPSHDLPPDYSGEKATAEQSAQYEWSQAESNVYSNRWALPIWQFSQRLPGTITPLGSNPSDNPSATGFQPDETGVPIFGQAVSSSAFGMTINSFSVDPAESPVYTTYIRPWRQRVGRVMHSVWSFIAAFSVFFIVRREWFYYTSFGKSEGPRDADNGGGIF